MDASIPLGSVHAADAAPGKLMGTPTTDRSRFGHEDLWFMTMGPFKELFRADKRGDNIISPTNALQDYY